MIFKFTILSDEAEDFIRIIEIDSEETRGIIPGKIFEYMVSDRPIIAIGPMGSDFEEILKTTNTGTFFTYDEKNRLKETILAHYLLFKEQNLKVYPVGLQKYSRKNLTKQLVDYLQKD